jgi:hypothetical protein
MPPEIDQVRSNGSDSDDGLRRLRNVFLFFVFDGLGIRVHAQNEFFTVTERAGGVGGKKETLAHWEFPKQEGGREHPLKD